MLSTSAASPVLVFVAYLLGSIPFGLILTKLFGGKDIRQHGSGNIGATNVSRVAGPVAGILTLLFDAAKGGVAVWLAGRLTGCSASSMIAAGIAALLGHCFPVWLKFKGGKGVATALGVFLILSPAAALAHRCLRHATFDLFSVGAGARATPRRQPRYAIRHGPRFL